MNLLLLHAEELEPNGTVTLRDDRFRHLMEILKVTVGSRVRVGVVDAMVGTGTVVRMSQLELTLECTLDVQPPEPGRDTLLLAFARPKVMLRCIEHATALGFGKLIFFRTRRVEKSHLASHAVRPEVMSRHVLRGLSQSRRTRRPSLVLFDRFMRLCSEGLKQHVAPGNRFLADPSGTEEAALCAPSDGGLSVAIGPEGGFVDHELQQLQEHGFRLVRAGVAPLRVETAVSYLTGQLRAARALARPDASAALRNAPPASA